MKTEQTQAVEKDINIDTEDHINREIESVGQMWIDRPTERLIGKQIDREKK